MGAIDTVAKLRKELEGLPDDMPLVVAVGTQTTVYPSAYVTPWDVTVKQGPACAIRVTLPEGQYIGQRKH